MIDVQRETHLGGPIHAKGVMILSAFLAARFAPAAAFARGHAGVRADLRLVEGDSASLAELAALLSSLADLPLKQGWALTGSVNQFGQAQAIGGVNEKIEGFFDVCAARGSTARRGNCWPTSST